jgi:hypothetical protein
MNIVRNLLLLALLGMVAACASSPRVMTDSDPNADFSRYRTFAFSDPLGTNRDSADTLLSQRLKTAAGREMTARGFVYQAQAPDLLLNFHAKLEEKVYSTPMIAPMFGYYGYRRGFYAAWPGWGFDNYVDTYTEGTLNIDLVDAARKKLIWESVVYGKSAFAAGPRGAAAVDTAIAAAFRRFPVPAPVAMPSGR